MEFKSKKNLIQSQHDPRVWFETPTLKTVKLFSREPVSDAKDPTAYEAKWTEWCFEVWDNCYRDVDGNKFTNIKKVDDLAEISSEDIRELLGEYADHIYGKQTEKKSTKTTGKNQTTPR